VVPTNESGGCQKRQREALWGCLTFELRGRNRDGAWPARRMLSLRASRAKCQAGGGPRSSEGLGPNPQLLLVNYLKWRSLDMPPSMSSAYSPSDSSAARNR
jgi:hypothetical protein